MLDESTDFTNAIQVSANISIIIQGIAVSAAAVFAAVQILQNSRAKKTDRLVEIFAEFHDPENYLTRERLQHHPSRDLGLSPELHADCLQVCDFFQRLAFLVNHRSISKKDALAMYSGAILVSFIRLYSFIQYMRTVRGLANYAVDFENLSAEAREYRNLRYPSAVGPLAKPSWLCAVPCFNTVDTIPTVIDSIRSCMGPDVAVEFIDDGSTDATSEILESENVKYHRSDTNAGYGATIKKALDIARSRNIDYVGVFPGDGQRDAVELVRMADATRSGPFDLCVGRKRLSLSSMPAKRLAFSGLARMVAKALLSAPYTDVTSGFKVYRVQALPKDLLAMLPDDFAFDFAFAALARELRLRVLEVDATVSREAYRNSSLRYPAAVGLKAIRSALEVKWSLRNGGGKRINSRPKRS